MDEPRLETLPGRFPAPLRDYAEKFNAREYMAAAHHEEMVVVWNRAQSHLYRGLPRAHALSSARLAPSCCPSGRTISA